MKSILLIIPYFGQWPLWFDAYLCSITKNPTINWLCPTDCVIPEHYPDNITFLKTNLPDLNTHVNKTVGVEVPLSPRKLCDVRLAYGDVFQEESDNYDFWGFCDMDIIWGDIRKFMTEEVLTTYDIISSRKENISGHFTLIKNKQDLNLLYRSVPEYNDFLKKEKLMRCDEELFSRFLKETQHSFQIKWDKILCNQEKGRDSHQEYYLNRWLWNKGKLLNTKTQEEVMYLHFINWKRTMRSCEISYSDAPKPFYVSYIGMHYQAFSKLRLMYNQLRNLFFGYDIRLKKLKYRRRLKKYIKY
jgi:hypothetical protein